MQDELVNSWLTRHNIEPNWAWRRMLVFWETRGSKKKNKKPHGISKASTLIMLTVDYSADMQRESQMWSVTIDPDDSAAPEKWWKPFRDKIVTRVRDGLSGDRVECFSDIAVIICWHGLQPPRVCVCVCDYVCLSLRQCALMMTQRVNCHCAVLSCRMCLCLVCVCVCVCVCCPCFHSHHSGINTHWTDGRSMLLPHERSHAFPHTHTHTHTHALTVGWVGVLHESQPSCVSPRGCSSFREMAEVCFVRHGRRGTVSPRLTQRFCNRIKKKKKSTEENSACVSTYEYLYSISCQMGISCRVFLRIIVRPGNKCVLMRTGAASVFFDELFL